MGVLVDPHRLAVASGFDVLAMTGLAGWYKGDAGLYQDSAKTTPATADTNPVGAWADQSAAGHDVLQATSGKRPILKVGILNGFPVVRADGIDDLLAAAYTRNQPHAVLLVAKVTSPSNSYLADGTATNQSSVIAASTSTARIYAGASVVDITAGVDTTEWLIWAARFNGASSHLAILDRTAAGNAGATNPGGLTLFNAGAEGQAMAGDMAEVIVCNAALSDAEVNAATAYLATKYGLTGTSL